jgi:subtilase family serine protease
MIGAPRAPFGWRARSHIMMIHKPRLLTLAIVCALLGLAPATAGAASAPGRLSLVLPLAARTAALQRYATQVATPGSPLYRHYRSIAWLSAHFGAPRAAEAKVVRYLRSHGGTQVRVDATGLFIDVTLPAARAETLFATQLTRRGSRADAYTAPTSQITIPPALRGTITGVVGLDTQPVLTRPSLQRASSATTTGTASAFTSLSAPITRTSLDEGSGYKSATGTTSGCAAATSIGGFTPNEYLHAYAYDGLQDQGTQGQGERVALIEVDGFKRADIQKFAACFGLALPKIVAFGTNRTVTKAGLAPGGEATLDLEVLDAAAPKLSQIDVYESSADIASALAAMTAPLQNSGYKPEVISASLGLCEPQVRQAIGLAGIGDVEASLQEAAASGISVLAASGDDGSADCVNSDSESAEPLPELAVNFPASSPWVTSVGGTNLVLDSSNVILSARVWNDDEASPGSAGGGGISSIFKRPSYQAAVVPGTNRAEPDLAMLADIGPGYDVYCSARPECVSDLPGETDPWQSVGGTSAATPLLAGGLVLIDELLRQHKQQSLGLINPLLYRIGSTASEAPDVFSDVTVGSNDVGPFIAGNQPLGCCAAGAGYDAASGWGGVNLVNLSTAALAAQTPIVNVTQTVPANTRAVARRSIDDQIACSGACQIGALARISVPGVKTVTLYSGLYHLTAAGSKLVKIPISAAEQITLKSDLLRHRRITATVVGAIVDPAGNIERQTPAKSVSLTG